MVDRLYCSSHYCRFNYLDSSESSLKNNKSREEFFASLINNGVKLDIQAVRERWKSHEGLISKFSSKSYDLYLKANQVKEGIENYSRVVDLVIRYYGKTNNRVAAAK